MSYAVMATPQEIQKRTARQQEAKKSYKRLKGLGAFSVVCTLGLFTPFAPLAMLGLAGSAATAGAIMGKYQAGETLESDVPPQYVTDFTPPTNFAERIAQRRASTLGAPIAPAVPSYYTKKRNA